MLPLKILKRNMHLTFLPCKNVQNIHPAFQKADYMGECFSLSLYQTIQK